MSRLLMRPHSVGTHIGGLPHAESLRINYRPLDTCDVPSSDPMAEFGSPVSEAFIAQRAQAEGWAFRGTTIDELGEALKTGYLPANKDGAQLSLNPMTAAQTGEVVLAILPQGDVGELGDGWLVATPSECLLRAFAVNGEWYLPTSGGPGTSGGKRKTKGKPNKWIKGANAKTAAYRARDSHAYHPARLPSPTGKKKDIKTVLLVGGPEAIVFDVTRPHPTMGFPPLRVSMGRINLFVNRIQRYLSTKRKAVYTKAKALLRTLYGADGQLVQSRRSALRVRIPLPQLRAIEDASRGARHPMARAAGWRPATIGDDASSQRDGKEIDPFVDADVSQGPLDGSYAGDGSDDFGADLNGDFGADFDADLNDDFGADFDAGDFNGDVDDLDNGDGAPTFPRYPVAPPPRGGRAPMRRVAFDLCSPTSMPPRISTTGACNVTPQPGAHRMAQSVIGMPVAQAQARIAQAGLQSLVPATQGDVRCHPANLIKLQVQAGVVTNAWSSARGY